MKISRRVVWLALAGIGVATVVFAVLLLIEAPNQNATASDVEGKWVSMSKGCTGRAHTEG